MDKDEWELKIVKWLYRLSLKYPRIKKEFKANGLGLFAGTTIQIYGDLDIYDNLRTEIKSLEAMYRDKPKKFRYESKIAPAIYAKSYGQPIELIDIFDKYRKELRDVSIDNLLGDE